MKRTNEKKEAKKKRKAESKKMQVITTKIHGETTLLLYSPRSPTELSAKLVAEKSCCAGLAAREQQVVQDCRD